VFAGTATGENNRFLTLFTRDLGLIRAVGKSLRSAKSKLRYHLQDYSRTHVTLVRGREVWRIIGAHHSINFHSVLSGEREKRLLMSRVFSLLSRLVQGEETDSTLFDIVSEGMVFLKTSPMDALLIRDFEYFFVIRILSELGYVGKEEQLKFLLASPTFSLDALADVSKYRKEAALAISQALEVSGL